MQHTHTHTHPGGQQYQEHPSLAPHVSTTRLPEVTHLLSAGVDPLPGVLVRDAAADLQGAGPGGQGLPGGGLVPGPEHDDVGAGERAVPVEPGEVGGRMRGDEVGPEGGGGALVQGPAHDLLHLPRVQVYAGAEDGHGGWCFLSLLASSSSSGVVGGGGGTEKGRGGKENVCEIMRLTIWLKNLCVSECLLSR